MKKTLCILIFVTLSNITLGQTNDTSEIKTRGDFSYFIDGVKVDSVSFYKSSKTNSNHTLSKEVINDSSYHHNRSIPTTYFSQTSQDTLNNNPRNYLEYLLYPNEKSQNHLFTYNYQFFYSAVGKTIGSRGTMANFGFNLARLFSTKIILGVVADIKILPGVWPIKPSNRFTSDFNDAFIKTYDNQNDSANASVVKGAFNRSNENIIGQNVFNFGMALSLFPQKYGGILLQVKYGGTGFQIHGVFGNKYVNNGANDKVGMSVTGNWIYEITFKPAAFLYNTYIFTDRETDDKFLSSFILSFYYERLNLKSAEFNGTTIDKMVSSDFINKYGIDNRFGFKIGFAFY